MDIHDLTRPRKTPAELDVQPADFGQLIDDEHYLQHWRQRNPDLVERLKAHWHSAAGRRERAAARDKLTADAQAAADAEKRAAAQAAAELNRAPIYSPNWTGAPRTMTR